MMQHFLSIKDVQDPQALVQEVLQIKKQPSALTEAQMTLGLLFFNPSLRTRLSSQKAASLMGIQSIVLDLAQSWALEFRSGAKMDQDKSEHIKEAAPVISQYCDLLGIRAFPGLKDRKLDYSEPIMDAFVQYAQVPIINLESATRHPLQGLADMATISELKGNQPCKVTLTWAPHPKALPQSVANSFVAWSLAMGHQVTITHPPGYELNESITQGAQITHDPREAYENAEIIYAKNWSSFNQYGEVLSQDAKWMVDSEKMKLTDQATFMHCLPVRRNVVVEDAVIDSSQSVVIEQANNRTYAAAAVLGELVRHRIKYS